AARARRSGASARSPRSSRGGPTRPRRGRGRAGCAGAGGASRAASARPRDGRRPRSWPATIAPPWSRGDYLAGHRRRAPPLAPSARSTDPEERQMPDVTTVIDGYIAMWNETDPERRRALIAETWTDDGSYVDPHADVDGADGID